MFNRIILYLIITFGLSGCLESCIMSKSLQKWPTDIRQGAIGDVGWSDLDNLKVDDGVNATASLTFGSTTFIIDSDNYQFDDIPNDATIRGIECNIEGYISSGAPTVSFLQIQMKIKGVASGINKAAGNLDATAGTVHTFGGSNDLWGLSLVAADVKASNTGVRVRFSYAPAEGEISLDHINLVVYYEITGGLCTSQIIRPALRTTVKIMSALCIAESITPALRTTTTIKPALCTYARIVPGLRTTTKVVN